VAAATSEPFGDLGLCDIKDAAFDGTRFSSRTRSIEILPSLGRLQFLDEQGNLVLFTVTFGVASCDCRVRISRGEQGEATETRSSQGVFFAYFPGSVDVTKWEAIDSSGRVVATHEVPPGFVLPRK